MNLQVSPLVSIIFFLVICSSVDYSHEIAGLSNVTSFDFSDETTEKVTGTSSTKVAAGNGLFLETEDIDNPKVYFYENGDDTTTIVPEVESTTLSGEGQETTEGFINEVNSEESVTTLVPPPVKSDPQPPHVILIIADDLGFNDVSFHGSPQIPTPNLDALALSGVILNSYYVSPICTPSRSALFSGRHPINTGMQHNVIFGTTPYGFPLQYKILPEFLKDLGYKTALVGKWHMGHFRRKYTPTCRGFDSHFGHWTGHKDYYDNTAQETGPQAWGYDMRRGLDTTYDHFGEYTTDLYTDEANSILKNHNKSSPLFLTISHTAVHSANPYQLLQAPKANIDSFSGTIKDLQRRTFAAMVQKMDDSVGSVIRALFEQEMLDNSVIIFTTDNGGPAAGFNGNAASNWPLRGVKNTLWEGGVRGAALIWSPLITPAARGVSNQMMHIQDWLPTILRAAGDPDPGRTAGNIDGMDMWDVIRLGLPSPRQEILHNIDDIYGNEGVRVGPWKLLHGTTYKGQWDGWYGPSGRKKSHKLNSTRNYSPEKIFHWARHSPAGKVISAVNMLPPELQMHKITQVLQEAQIQCNDTITQLRKRKSSCSLISGEYCLFNILEDPCEFNNLAKQMPDKVEELKEALIRYREGSVPPINKPKDPRGLPIHWNYTWTNWVDFLEESEYKSEC